MVIKRIFLAFNALPHYSTLQTAANLAAELQIELSGLFIEDINLLRLSELSNAQEQTYIFGQRHFNLERLVKNLRYQAEQTRKMLVKVAEESQVPWSFQVVRGQFLTEIVTATHSADLVLFGQIQHPFIEYGPLNISIQKLVDDLNRNILLLEQGRNLPQPVIVFFDGSPQAIEILSIATFLVHGPDGYLLALIFNHFDRFSQMIQKELSSHPRKIRCFCQEVSEDSNAWNRELFRLTQGTLVIPANHPLATEDEIVRLSRKTNFAVVVVPLI